MYDFHARYYNPVLGRWFNIDPALAHANPYLYANNNPMMFVDPDGELPFLAFIAVYVGAKMTIEYVSQVVVNIQSGDSFANAFWNNVDFADVLLEGAGGFLEIWFPAAAPYIKWGMPVVKNAVNFYGSGEFENIFDGSISMEEWAINSGIDLAAMGLRGWLEGGAAAWKGQDYNPFSTKPEKLATQAPKDLVESYLSGTVKSLPDYSKGKEESPNPLTPNNKIPYNWEPNPIEYPYQFKPMNRNHNTNYNIMR